MLGVVVVKVGCETVSCAYEESGVRLLPRC
jgi:hypothetical protein